MELRTMESTPNEGKHRKKKSKKKKIKPSTQQYVTSKSNFMNATAAGGSTIQYRNNNITNQFNIIIPGQGSTTQDCLEEDASKLSEKLEKVYKNIRLPNVPWMNDGNLPLGSRYVDLQLDVEQRSISIKKIFDDVKPLSQVTEEIGRKKKEPKRILISAPPGYGKTSLAYKIVHDWARHQEEYVRRFKLAFLIKLRILEKNLTIQSKIANIAKKHGFKKKSAVSKILSKNASSTLVILDGLDELKKGERNNVLKVLFGEELSDVTVIATSRTGAFTVTKEEMDDLNGDVNISNEFQDRKVTIQELSASNRNKLLEKIVRSPVKHTVLNHTRNIIEHIESHYGANRELLQCPLFVILLAFIVEEKPDVKIETQTDLFKCLIDCMIRRSCSRNGTELDRDFTVFGTKKSWNYYRNVLHAFGKLSYNVLVDGIDGMQFKCTENSTRMYENGFLVKHCDVNPFSTRNYYEAFHLSVMEFAVAYFLWSDYKNKNCAIKKETIRKIISLYDDVRRASLMIPFLFGLLGDELSNFLNVLLPYRITFFKSYEMAHYFADCKSIQNLPDTFHVFFPKLMTSSEWLDQSQLLNKILPWKTLVFGNGIKGKDFVNLSQSVEVKYLQIEINSQCNYDVPTEFDFSKIRCKRLQFIIRSREKKIEKWLEIFNSITATKGKKLRFSFDCKVLDLPKAATDSFGSCQIVLKTKADCQIANYTNLSEVVLKSFTQLESIPENIFSVISVSANVQILCIYNYKNNVDIGVLTNCGKKRWEMVSLDCVKTVNCSSELVNNKCIAFFRNITCVNSSSVFGLIVPGVLHCDDGYITEALKSSLFLAHWPSVTELILEIHNITSYTEIMSRLTNICHEHKPTIRLRLLVYDYSRKLQEVQEVYGDCAETYNEHAIMDFLNSIDVTEVYCVYERTLTSFHSESCVFKSFARIVLEKQIKLHTLIIFDHCEDCINDAFACVSGGKVVRCIVVLDPENLPDIDVVSQFDVTKFNVQYGYVSDFCSQVYRGTYYKSNECICVSLNNPCQRTISLGRPQNILKSK